MILPLVAAPALSAFLFVFVLSASDYVTPQFLGGSSGVMLGVQVQANFTTDRQLPAGRRAWRCSCWRRSCCSTSRCGSACACARLDRVRFVSDTVRSRSPARDHDRRPGLPLRAARDRRALLVPLHGRRSRSRSRVLAALVPLRAPDPGFRSALENSLLVADLRRSLVTLLIGHARLVRAGPHALRGCAGRSRCCSSCRSRCPACSSASRCSCSSCGRISTSR